MDDALRRAVQLFNEGSYSEFQDAIDAVAVATRAASERQFYTLLNRLAEALLQLSDGDLEDAEAMMSAALRKLDGFLPRFRGLNTQALREECGNVVLELREVRAGRKSDWAPTRLPRLRVLPE
jgi:hypothetical protein